MRARVVVVAAAVAASVSACDSGGGTSGQPGPTSQVQSTASETPTPPKPTDSDVEYVRAMLLHRGQRVDMARLAQRRAKNPQVKRLAASISGSQAGPISTLKSWLKTRAGTKNAGPKNDVPGMVGKSTLDKLANAKGAAFDRLFLQTMITQDDAALKMAQDVQLGGVDAKVQTFAAGVITTYSAEIARMRAMKV